MRGRDTESDTGSAPEPRIPRHGHPDSPLPSHSECAPTAAGLDELTHDGLAVAAARGGEAPHLLRVKAHIVSAADKVSEEQIVAW